MSTPTDKAAFAIADEDIGALKSSFLGNSGCDGDDKLAALHRRDREIDLIRSHMSEVSAFRNELSPAVSLPEELLVSIFERLIPDPTVSTAFERTWMTVARVCSRWRAVALNRPSLWTRIFVNKIGESNEVDTMLARAKHAPLTLIGDFYALKDTQIVKIRNFIVENTHRVRHLTLGGGAPMRTLVERLEGPAPELRDLILSNTEQPEVILPNIGHARKKICSLSKSFASSMPSIRHINLLEIYFPWPTNLTNVTKLHVSFTPREGNSFVYPGKDFTLTDVLQSLQHMPSLTDLLLNHVLPHPTNENKNTEVRLPRLHSLRLAGTFDAVFTLWKCLVVPVRASQFLSFTDDRVQDVNEFRSGLKRRVLDTADVSLQHLRISSTFGNGLSFSLSAPLVPVHEITPYNQQTISASFYGHTGTNALPNFCYDFAVSAPLRQLVSLSLNASHQNHTFDQVTSLLDRAQALERLHLTWPMSSIIHLFAALVPPDHRTHSKLLTDTPEEHEVEASIRLPKLYFLRIDELAANTIVHGNELGEELVCLLRCRKKAGAPIRELRLPHAHLRTETAEKIRGIVPTLDWSGGFHEVMDDGESSSGEGSIMDF